MNKLYISVLSAMLCVQQTQSCVSTHKFEKQVMPKLTEKNEYLPKIIEKNEYCRILRESQNFDTTERFIYVESPRYHSDSPLLPFSIKQKVDLLSLKLYNTNLNESEIEELVKQGADVNYKEPECLYFNDTTIPAIHAMNKTEQGIKNMQKLITLGAHLHFTDIQDCTPLCVAIQKNITPMIKLLLPYEKIETSTWQERKARKAIISYSLNDKSFEVISMLLQLKLMTPNQGLNELISLNQPNVEILNYLIDNGANNHHTYLNQVADNAFSGDSIQMLNLLSQRGAFNKEVLTRMHIIKALVDSTITNLENNQTK